MPERGRARTWILVILVIAIGFVVLMLGLPRLRPERSLAGAVLMADADPRKQLPLANVDITATASGRSAHTRSAPSGYFQLSWPSLIWQGQQVTIQFRHPGYQPLDITQPLNRRLCIAHMMPSAPGSVEPHTPEVTVANVRVRYSLKAITTINFGSVARTFEVVNTGNVPCEGRSPCSPDGRWKADTVSLSLDAGEGKEFRNARVSCIAGPCAFTRIESDEFSRGGRKISVSVRAWSDTVTFLAEAEVVHTMLSDEVRRSYPSIFGRAMTFTLPATGQGPSIEAEINGTEIVFPLGPDLRLSWANCTVQVAPSQSKLYSCELKPGYRFP